MIYCVVPQALADELYDKLADYYRDDPHVEVIIDRRAQGGSPGDHPSHADRRRRRPKGSFPVIEAPAAVRIVRLDKVVVHVDGGARGNPGPAAAAAVATTPDGDELAERNEYIGEATNNVAEYRALLLGLQLAQELGAREVEVVNDSELVARQVGGEYKVKNAGLKPLFLESMRKLREFDSWAVRSVRREHNERADELVNEALDSRTPRA